VKRVLLAALLLFSITAHAHKASDSYLSLVVDGDQLRGRWDIALRDLAFALALDLDENGLLTWGELRANAAPIAEYAVSRLRLSTSTGPCLIRVTDQLVDRHVDGSYAVLDFNAACVEPTDILGIDYRLLFDLDPQHRGLLRLTHDGVTRTAVLGPDQPMRRFSIDSPNRWATVLDYGKLGIWHIASGIDHLLFLIALLLPSIVRRIEGRWVVAESFTSTTVDIAKLVTAFTLAHSLTLAVSALDVWQPPSRWVEPLIAASVAIAALNNLWPILNKHRSVLAFAFGLVHGFGFAGVLTGLKLPSETLGLALLGFNLGVEFGQLAIVALWLPLAYALRHRLIFSRVVLPLGSTAIIAVAMVWTLERSLGASWLPWS
jgi:hypothetical protein